MKKAISKEISCVRSSGRLAAAPDGAQTVLKGIALRKDLQSVPLLADVTRSLKPHDPA